MTLAPPVAQLSSHTHTHTHTHTHSFIKSIFVLPYNLCLDFHLFASRDVIVSVFHNNVTCLLRTFYSLSTSCICFNHRNNIMAIRLCRYVFCIYRISLFPFAFTPCSNVDILRRALIRTVFFYSEGLLVLSDVSHGGLIIAEYSCLLDNFQNRKNIPMIAKLFRL